MQKSSLTVSINQKLKYKLNTLAMQQEVSKSEIIRRALEEYDPEALEALEKLMTELEQRTLHSLLQSNQKIS